MERPQSSLPREVERYLAAQYSSAAAILEYGSGASTVIAAEMPDKTIFSVESDKFWARNLRRYLASADFPSRPVVQYADIGKTGKWGRPVDDSGWRRWHLYPSSVWDLPGFKHPDCVLIDGRFRVACFYMVLIRAEKPVTVLFDDYTHRAYYRSVEKLRKPAEYCGRMARFDVKPGEYPRPHTTKILSAFTKPF